MPTATRGRGTSWRSISALTWLAWGLAEPGDFSAALSAGERAVQLSERHDTPFGLFHACMGLGIAQLMKDEIDRAITTLLRAAAVAEASDLPLMANAVQACAGPPIFTAIFEEATARLKQATKYTESAGFMAFHPLALVHRSEAYLRSGDQEQAAEIPRTRVEKRLSALPKNRPGIALAFRHL
jgi:hypothetical protein